MATIQLREGTLVHEVSSDLLQVGSTPEHAVLFSRLTEQEKRWIESLKPESSPRAGRGKTGSLPTDLALTERQQEILSLLEAASLLGEAPNPLSRLRIRIDGLDRVGVHIARLLVHGGLTHLEVRDNRRVDLDVEHLFSDDDKGTLRSLALRKELSTNRKLRLGRISHPDLVISTNNRIWDHGSAGILLSHDINHLPILCDDRSIQVGPLIAPGITACAVCLDLHVTELIPTWPLIHLALRETKAPPPSDHMAATAAGLAVTMIEAIALGVSLDVTSTNRTSIIRNHASARTPVTAPRPIQNVRDRRDEALGGNTAPSRRYVPSYSWRVTQRGVEPSTWRPHPECRCSRDSLMDQKNAS